jgi:hypothetical protein
MEMGYIPIANSPIHPLLNVTEQGLAGARSGTTRRKGGDMSSRKSRRQGTGSGSPAGVVFALSLFLGASPGITGEHDGVQTVRWKPEPSPPPAAVAAPAASPSLPADPLPAAGGDQVGYDIGDFETAAGPTVGFALDGIVVAGRRFPRDGAGVLSEPADPVAEFAVPAGKGPQGNRDKLQLIRNYARTYDLDWALIAAIARVESGFNQNARGAGGAVGVMQLLPSTAASRPLNMPNVKDLETNIHAGVKYFRHLVDAYFADARKDGLLMALAAYKAGPARLVRFRDKARREGLDPTRWHGHVEAIAVRELGADVANYVDDILRHYARYRIRPPRM